MKKPKKTTAKARARRAISKETKSPAKLGKPAKSPPAAPRKAPAKRAAKTSMPATEVTALAKTKRVLKLKATIEPLQQAKARPGKIKATVQPKTAAENLPPVEPAPVKVAPAKIKASVKAKPAVEPPPPVQAPPVKAESVKSVSVQPPVKPVKPVEPAPAAEAKAPVQILPPAKPKRFRAKTSLKPKTALAKSKLPEEIAAPVKPKPASLAGLVAEAHATPEIRSLSGVSSEAKQTARAARKAPARIPPILLEGDEPAPAPASGPGQRYALGPTPPIEKLQTEGDLPESYETGELLLTARDPHWLYTHWDLSDDQQRRCNAFSRDGHLVVRIYIEAPGGKPVAEVHVHPESRHWFIHVGQANTRYVAELGYYSAADKWKVVSTSSGTLTPPDAVAAETSAEFGTIPFEVPMQKLLSLVKEAVHENAPLAQALQELRAEGHPDLPPMEVETPAPRGLEPPFYYPAQPASSAQPPPPAHRPRSKWKPSQWTPAQERALADVISMDHVRRVWMGSLEITELIRRQFVNELASMAAAELSAPGAPTSPAAAITGISSPSAKEARPPKGFWFNVNAELIVYGATEKDATVSVGGRRIKLRPDGSFSYRFALPDGRYEMPIVAISADQTDGRAAEMKFSRGTEYRGHVGAHPQDPALRQLLLENF